MSTATSTEITLDLTLTSPLHHGAGNAGNTALLRTEEAITPDGTPVTVSNVTVNGSIATSGAGGVGVFAQSVGGGGGNGGGTVAASVGGIYNLGVAVGGNGGTADAGPTGALGLGLIGVGVNSDSGNGGMAGDGGNGGAGANGGEGGIGAGIGAAFSGAAALAGDAASGDAGGLGLGAVMASGGDGGSADGFGAGFGGAAGGQARDRCMQRGKRLQALGRCAGQGHHATHSLGDSEHAQQPHGRCLHA